ncbi:MAG: endonuclease, partial [Planctomycetota bacterium]
GAFGQSFGVVQDGGTYWYPGDDDAGMIARQQFYVAVRYDGSDSQTNNLELVAGNPGTGGTTMGNLNRLLEWHYQATPDDFERGRNQIIYDDYQGNRNPFIDHPEWVHSVFVDQANDTNLSLTAASGNADGSSSQILDLGRTLVDGPGPSTQQVTLFKSGSDGTYYSATTSGAATSSITGDLNAFAIGSGGSQQVTVGLDANTSQAGLTTGEVRFDNLDITTGGGSGRGANDGDDVVQLSYTTVDHATPSWDGSLVNTQLEIDFGEVELGASVSDTAFELFNLEQTAGFTADLELDSISGLGTTGVLTVDPTVLTGPAAIEGGDSATLHASFDTSTAGNFGALYTLSLSDEDLPGAQSYELSLLLLGSVVDPALAGDFNGDDMVTAADYAVWRDGASGGEDYATWVEAFGDSQAAASIAAAASVPEPGAAIIGAVGVLGLVRLRRRV